MKQWEILDSELNELAGLQQDATRAFAWAAFWSALGIDIVRDVLTSGDMLALWRVLWTLAALFAFTMAVKSWLNGRYAKKRGATRLQQIKDEHDHGDEC